MNSDQDTVNIYNAQLKDLSCRDPDESLTYVKVCTPSLGKAFNVEIDEFIKVTHELFTYYINKSGEGHEVTTSPYNKLTIMDCDNLIYLDGDYYFNESLVDNEAIAFNDDIAMNYTNVWLNMLENKGFTNVQYFVFVPSTYNNRKYGFHTMIILDKPIELSIIKNIYETIRNNVEIVNNFFRKDDQYVIVNDYLSGDDINYYKVFDHNTIIKRAMLLPFAEKQGSTRRYKLLCGEYTKLILCPEHIIEVNGESEYNDNEESDNTDNDESNENVKVVDNDSEDIPRYPATEILKLFLSSLYYLSDNHPIWKEILSVHEERFKSFYIPLASFITCIIGLTKPDTYFQVRFENFAYAILDELIPLMQRATEVSGKYDSKRMNEDVIISELCGAFNMKHVRLNEGDITYLTKYIYNRPKSVPNNERININIVDGKINRRLCLWITFVEYVFDNLSNELEPFEKGKPRRNGIETRTLFQAINSKDTFYIKTLRNLILMGMFTQLFQTATLRAAIDIIIFNLTKRYVYRNVDKPTLNMIYNLKQTESLSGYSYNQWVKDPNSTKLSQWIALLYTKLIRVELVTTESINRFDILRSLLKNLNTFKGNKLPTCLTNNGIREVGYSINSIIQSLNNDVLAWKNSSVETLPEQLKVKSNWFPMRNGLLEIITDPNVPRDKRLIFHKDNLSRWMPAYTNILWDDNYDKNNQYYQTLLRTLRDTYPVDEIFNYIMSLRAATIVGNILMDTCVFMLGSGGDGKSVSADCLMSMLNCPGYNNAHNISEVDGTSIIAEQPGLANIVKSQAISSNKDASSHDESGLSMTVDVRAVLMNEAVQRHDQEVQTQNIKLITGGAKITSRKIFSEAVTKQVNVLLEVQTNDKIQFDACNRSITRRIVVIVTETKFVPAKDRERYSALQFVRTANPRLIEEITNDPRYWQAMFYILLDYGLNLIDNGYGQTSDIPVPAIIEKSTNNILQNSNRIGTLLNTLLTPCEGRCTSVANLLSFINQVRQTKSRASKVDQTTILSDQIINFYLGQVYLLRENLLTKRIVDGLPHYTVDNDMVNKVINCRDCKTSTELIEKFFEPYAVATSVTYRTNDMRDMFIVNYQIRPNIKNEEIQMLM